MVAAGGERDLPRDVGERVPHAVERGRAGPRCRAPAAAVLGIEAADDRRVRREPERRVARRHLLAELAQPEAHDVAAQGAVRRVVDGPAHLADRVRRAGRGRHEADEGDETEVPATRPRRAGRASGAEHSVITSDAMTSKVAVLGAGAWGTALAKVLADKGDDVSLWSRRRDLCEAVNASRENARYLPGARLPASLACTDDLASRARRGAAWSSSSCRATRRARSREPRRRTSALHDVAHRERHEGHRERLADVHGRGPRRGAPAAARATASRSSRVRASPRSSRAACRPPSSSPRATPTSART